jgi:transcriptional regulator with XRE-family HTH domain
MRRRDAPKGEQGFNRKIGQRLRELRVLNGLTQTELGQKVGVSYQQVQKYERVTNNMTTWKLTRFAESLGVTVNEFLCQEALPTDGAAPTNDRMAVTAMRSLQKIERESPETFAALCDLMKVLGEKKKRTQRNKANSS